MTAPTWRCEENAPNELIGRPDELGVLLIRVEVFDTWPVYMQGLVDALGNCLDMKVVGAKTSSAQGLSWNADLFLIDPDISAQEDFSHFLAEASRIAPVVLLLATRENEPIYASLGVQRFAHRWMHSTALAELLRSAASGEDQADGHDRGCAAVLSGEGDMPPLSRREAQVLWQVARGMTHGQIARALAISPHTVDTYVKRIRAKWKIGNKAELARAAVLTGVHQASAAGT